MSQQKCKDALAGIIKAGSKPPTIKQWRYLQGKCFDALEELERVGKVLAACP